MKVMQKAVKKSVNGIISKLDAARFMHLYPKESITILTYHCIANDSFPIDDYCYVSESNFRDQLSYLKDHFHLIKIEDDFDTESDKPKAIITFDDGFLNNYEHAFPILKNLGIPFTIYLSTGFIDGKKTLWFTRLLQALIETKKAELIWNKFTLPLGDRESKSVASNVLQRELKKLPPKELENTLEIIISALGVDPEVDYSGHIDFGMLSSDAIREMLESGLVTFGAHTHDHTILTRLDIDAAKQQIERSIRGVEAITGLKCEHFAYPNGGRADYTQDHAQFLQELGIKTAVTMIPGLANDEVDPYHIPRQFVSSSMKMQQFKLLAHGLI